MFDLVPVATYPPFEQLREQSAKLFLDSVCTDRCHSPFKPETCSTAPRAAAVSLTKFTTHSFKLASPVQLPQVWQLAIKISVLRVCGSTMTEQCKDCRQPTALLLCSIFMAPQDNS